MPRSILLLLVLLLPVTAHAGDRGIFAHGFDPPTIAPLFPSSGASFALPPGPATDQLAWLLDELASDASTSIAEIEAHFDAGWLAQTSAAQTQAFIGAVRADYPDAVVTDVITVTPTRVTVLIDTPGTGAPSGFLTFGSRYTGQQGITLLGVGSYGGSVQYPADRALTLPQAADRFMSLSDSGALLVGRIEEDGTCSALVERNPDALRATASIFKIWVLGAIADAVAAGAVASADTVPMLASELAPGGVINIEPVDTPFPIGDLATLMMGISDNTATDLLHELAGREFVGAIVAAYGVAQPAVLTPFLGINEQFHVFYSFPLQDALAFVEGSEAFQQQFLAEEIEPLGPVTSTPYFHEQLLVDGTWRASASDVCRAFAALRRLPPGSEALAMVERALGASVAQPDVRGDFDRVWYKGGSLAATPGSFHVLTHAWMLEDAGDDPYVVIALANSGEGGIDGFQVQSVTGRLLELVAQRP